jgi:hypothetical protein
MRKAIKKAPAAIAAGAKGLLFVESQVFTRPAGLKCHNQITRGLKAAMAPAAARQH